MIVTRWLSEVCCVAREEYSVCLDCRRKHIRIDCSLGDAFDRRPVTDGLDSSNVESDVGDGVPPRRFDVLVGEKGDRR